MNVARFKVEFYDKTAEKEYLSLDGSVRAMVDKGIARLALRADEIGKPLSTKPFGQLLRKCPTRSGSWRTHDGGYAAGRSSVRAARA